MMTPVSPYNDLESGISGGGTQIGLHPNKKSLYFLKDYKMVRYDLINNTTTPLFGTGTLGTGVKTEGGAFDVAIRPTVGIYITEAEDIYISETIVEFMRKYTNSTKSISVFAKRNSYGSAAMNSNYYPNIPIYSAFGTTIPDLTDIPNFPTYPLDDLKYGMAYRKSKNELYYSVQGSIYKYSFNSSTSSVVAKVPNFSAFDSADNFDGEKNITAILTTARGMHFINDDEMLLCTPRFLNIFNVNTNKIRRYAGTGSSLYLNNTSLAKTLLKSPTVLSMDYPKGTNQLLLYDVGNIVSCSNSNVLTVIANTAYSINRGSTVKLIEDCVYYLQDNTLRILNLTTGEDQIIAGNSNNAAKTLSFNAPNNKLLENKLIAFDFAVCPDKSIYATDRNTYYIVKINLSTNLMEYYAGTGSSSGNPDGPINSTSISPVFIHCSKRNVIYFSDGATSSFRKIVNDKFVTVVGGGSTSYSSNPPSTRAFNTKTDNEDVYYALKTNLFLANKYGYAIKVFGDNSLGKQNHTLPNFEDNLVYNLNNIYVDRNRGDIFVNEDQNVNGQIPASILKLECQGNCTAIECNGLSEYDPNVCGGIAGMKCFGFDVCDCTDDYKRNGSICLPICFGIASDDIKTCSGFGQCTAPNTCVCNRGKEGSNCSLNSTDTFDSEINNSTKSNFTDTNTYDNSTSFDNSTSVFINSTDVNQTYNSTVNSTTQSNDTLQSNDSNLQNQTLNNSSFINNSNNNTMTNNTTFNDTKCYGKLWNDTSVCNGRGICSSTNKCTCFQTNIKGFFTGIECESCIETYYGQNCNVQCVDSLTCSNHGKCNQQGECTCNSSNSTGYWNGTKCQECSNEFYGDECSTKVIGPIRFSNQGSSLIFKLNYPKSFTQTLIDCTKLLDSSIFGSNPSCYYLDRNANDFIIDLDQDHSILVNSIININRNVFNKNPSLFDYQSFKVETALNPVNPIIKISQKDSYGSCENIIIDASESYSLDRKSLSFEWNLFDSNVLSLIGNTSKLIIPYSDIQSGQHTLRLNVKSMLFGSISSKDLIFTKLAYSTPIITIDGSSEISAFTNDLPIYFKKKIQLPDCIDVNSQIIVEWTLLEGNQVEYQQDSFNNLKITKFSNLSCTNYQFKVSSYIKGKEQQISSSIVKVNLQVNSLSVKLLTVESNSGYYTFEISQSDPDNEPIPYETKWSITNFTSLSSDLLNYLNSASSDNIKTIPQSLIQNNYNFYIMITISKNLRSASDVLSISFPQPSQKIAPIISLLNSPPTRVNPSDELSIELSISSQSTNLQRKWLLNGVEVDNSLTNMRLLPSESNILILNTDTLSELSINTIQFIVTDSDGLSSTFSHTFTINKSPRSCQCEVSPTSGIALTTSFTFNCPSCQNEAQSYKFEYGFVDDFSSSYIALSTDDTMSQKLPVSYFGNDLQLYVKVIDSLTGAKAITLKHVTVTAPKVSSIIELKKYVQQWNQVMNLLPVGDIRRSVFNSATISRTSDRMKLQLQRRRSNRIISSSTCYGNGQLQQDGTCKCKNGYISINCRWNSEQYQTFIELSKSLLDNMMTIENQRYSSGERITTNYFTNTMYGLDSLLHDLDSVSLEIIDSGLQFLNSTLSSITISFYNNEQVYLKSILNSMYTYLHLSNSTNKYWEEILRISRMIGPIMLNSQTLGKSSLKFESVFEENLLNKHLKSELNGLQLISENVNVTVPSTISKTLKLKSLKSSVNYNLYNLKKFTSIENPNPKEYEIYSIVSNIMMIDLIPSTVNDVSNQLSFKYSFKLNENIKKNSTIECVEVLNSQTVSRNPNCTTRVESSTLIKCECTSLLNLAILELIPVKSNSVIEPVLPPNINPNITFDDLMWILWAILIFIGIVFIIIVKIIIIAYICRMVRTTKKEAAPQVPNNVELVSV